MTLFFDYNKNSFGGTENMARYFHKNVANNVPKFKKYNCLILPGQIDKTYFELINEEKEIIIWLHNFIDQFEIKIYHLLTEKRFINKIKYIITVSEYHKQDVIKKTGIDPNKVIVIYNAINPIRNNINRFNNVDVPKLIYTSSSHRGLDIALKSLHKLDFDFRLNIFSETIPDTLELKQGTEEFEIMQDQRFFFYGKTPHKTVLDYFAKSHIFILPSTYPETFCLSLAESLSANCLSVYNNLASLKEIGNNFGINYSLKNELDYENHIQVFSKKITEAIIKIKTNNFNPKKQSETINKKYSSDVFISSWIKLNNKL